ncbi:hypothetical protein OAV36_05210 [Flavobacteriales bacterium]|nr:hypothetical protein [Flavobacteriales bacterium]
MKRVLFFLGLISAISVYSQPPVTPTFEVDLSLYQGTYSTVEFYRGGQLYSMVNTIGNTYEYTAFSSKAYCSLVKRVEVVILLL